MHRVLVVTSLVLLLAVPAHAAAPVEVQIALESLRTGERARLEKALGPAETLPLYRVELDVAPASRVVTGNVFLTITPKRPLAELHLRLTPNAAHAGAVTVTSLEVEGEKQPWRLVDPSLLRVRFSSPLEAGKPTTLSLKLTARVPALSESDSIGSMASRGGDYGAFSAGGDLVSLPGIVPMVAPVKDNGELAEGPSGIGDLGLFDPSNFVVAVTVPSGWRALAPGLLSGEIPEKSGRQRFTYTLAGARELPVLVTRGYVSETSKVQDITVESWHSSRNATSGKRVLEFAAQGLQALDARLGPYPYKTLRVVEARFQGGAGGMEFPGLVTVSRTLYEGTVNPLAALGLGVLGDDEALGHLMGDMGPMLKRLFDTTLEFTVAHELAHQYFAMLVGNDPILEPVVDEALTQHVALLMLEWHHGKPAADELRAAQLKAAYQLHRMMGGKDAAANRPTWAFDSNVEYAALVYGKAPLLFDAWRDRLGNEAWLAVLRTYVEENRYRWVTATTLREVAQRRQPKDGPALAALQRHWWDEAHGDEDIGVFSGELSGAAGTGLDPKLLQEYEEAMKQLLGGE